MCINLMVTTNLNPKKDRKRTKRKELKQSSNVKQQTIREETERRKEQGTTIKTT